MQPLDLASLISYHRKRAGLSQKDLAEYADVSRNVVQDLEAGKERASWRNLRAVLEVLNLQLEPVGPLVEAWKGQRQQQQDGEETM